MQQQIQDAVSCLQAGDFQQAASLTQSYIEQSPMAKMVYAIAQGKLGKLKEAYSHLQQLHQTFPKNLDVLFNHGLLLKDNGELDRAEQKFLACINLQPSYHPALHALGNVCSLNKMYEQSLKYFEQAFVTQKQNIMYLCSYSDALCTVSKALDATKLFAHINLNNGTALRSFMRACYFSEQRELSKTVLRSGEVTESTDSYVRLYAGLIETDEKRYIAAIEHFNACNESDLFEDDREALTLNIWLCKFLSNPVEVEVKPFIERVTSVNTQQGMQFAIRILDRLGKLNDAEDFLDSYRTKFQKDNFYFIQSAVISRQLKNYDKAHRCIEHYTETEGEDLVSLTEMVKLYDAESNFKAAAEIIEKLAAHTNAVEMPPPNKNLVNDLPIKRVMPDNTELLNLIVIVGYPRTGTTLLETRISASLPTYVLEETSMSADFFNGLASKFNVRLEELAGEISRLPQTTWNELRLEYLTFVSSYGTYSQSNEVLVDKMPLNYAVLPAYLQLFPEATIVQCYRDPRDTFISSLMHEEVRINSSESFLHSYSPTVGYWKVFKDTYSENCVEVKYEAFVQQEEKILAFILSRFDLNNKGQQKTRLINSPSYLQASQALYTTSTKRYENYLPYMPELERKFDDVVKILGYK